LALSSPTIVSTPPAALAVTEYSRRVSSASSVLSTARRIEFSARPRADEFWMRFPRCMTVPFLRGGSPIPARRVFRPRSLFAIAPQYPRCAIVAGTTSRTKNQHTENQHTEAQHLFQQ